MEGNPSYGTSLPDQVEKIAWVSDAQLEILGDVRDIYKDLVALEREFATKLQQLARKASDRKVKKIYSTVFGTTPTKPYDAKILSSSTLERAYNQLITSLVDSAQDHSVLADALTSQVIDVLRTTEKKHEETNKRQMLFYQKMLADREKAYADRLKTKEKYDGECVEVELYRQKQEKSSDDRHAERAARQYDQQQSDMLNSKNVYILSTALANSAKAKYFGEDLPAVENQLQMLQTQVLVKLSTIVRQAQTIQTGHLDSLKSRVTTTDAAFQALDPAKDQALFIEHNASHFAEPPDWSFEPCSTHYDTDEMSVEPVPKVYLQNRLSKCKEKLQEVQTIIASKRKEVDQLQTLVQTYSADTTLGDPDSVSDNYLGADHQLTFFTTSERMLLTEIETITSALGGDEGTQSPHNFKSSSFSIPTQCVYCKSSIWGLSKQGKTCKSCGISVHNKCELKVPADCGSSKDSRHGASPSISKSYTSLSRSGSRASTTSALTTPSPSSFAQSDPSSTQEETYPAAQVVFDFTPTSPFELSVKDGDVVRIVEEDDGSGWVKVTDGSGGKGLVPASYVKLQGTTPQHVGHVSPSGATGSGRPQGSGEYVRASYDYHAQGSDELNLQEGELLELTGSPSGGQHYADGWWEGLDSSGRKGIFPSNYVEIVP